MSRRYLEAFEIGEKSESSVGRTISEFDVYMAAGLQGSYGELFLNKPKMKESKFGGRLVQGVLLILLMNGFAQRLSMDSETIALYGFDNIRFIAPVFIGDTVYMTAEVTDIENIEDDRGLLTTKEDLYKESDDSIAVTRERIRLVRREP